MSLDVGLFINEPSEPRAAIFIRRNGANVEITREEWDDINPGVEPIVATVNAGGGGRSEVYSDNITHNLNSMADAVGIYEHLWRPEEIGVKKAAQLIEPLAVGLALLKSEPARFKAFNSPNGWGMYEHFVPFVQDYLEACKQHPDADVWVSR